jgi:hypothetical protein
MMDIITFLVRNGPCRSSKIAAELQSLLGISSENARQKIARSGGKIKKFPYPLLPNRESFVYLEEQRTTEDFWIQFLNDLRETNSIYGFTLDSLIAKGGIIKASEFAVISGAPLALKGQVASQRVSQMLIGAGAIRQETIDNDECFVINRPELCDVDYPGYRPKQMVERIILETLKDWSKKMGLASYNLITIRPGDGKTRTVGAFQWDLSGPSYLLPLRKEDSKPGFLVADVFTGSTLNEHSINYIIRKSQLLKASIKGIRFLPILLADSFTGPALTKGRKEGIILATPENIFGSSAARGLQNLLDTLKNAAAIASANPDRLLKLIDQLKDIEGAAGNLRGILFELISAYIAKVQGGSIEFGINAKDPDIGKSADIDVFRIVNKAECVAIECKGKMPGGSVSKEEVEDWLKRLPIFIAHLRDDKRFAEAKISFELWTSGSFQPNAIELLEKEQIRRKKNPIKWLNGTEVFNISNTAKEKRINDTLKEHFLKHPLAN